MTIASEITRLQNDKAAMCAAIESKGVTVGNVTFDDYASCINAIQSGGNIMGAVNYLVVGGGGGGGRGGGGGGAVCLGFLLMGSSADVVVGAGGTSAAYSAGGSGCPSSVCSSVGCVVANGGCGGIKTNGSGYNCGGASGSGCLGGGATYSCRSGGGGGGATGNGIGTLNSDYGGIGGPGLCGYGGGGGGGGSYGPVCCGGICYEKGCDGGGDGNFGSGGNATNCGGGGGGAGCYRGVGGSGGNGVVDICYIPDGSFGFTSATGGNCCYTCDGYCVHRFTSDGTFTIIS